MSVVEALADTQKSISDYQCVNLIIPLLWKTHDTQVKRLNEKCAVLNKIVTQLVADVEQQKGTLSQMNTFMDHLSQVVPRVSDEKLGRPGNKANRNQPYSNPNEQKWSTAITLYSWAAE